MLLLILILGIVRTSLDSEDGYSPSSSDVPSSEDSSSSEEIYRPQKKRAFAPQSKAELKTALDSCPGPPPEPPPEPLLTVEIAKSGRSKCRACMEPIPKGATRVGMKSFIAGRVTQTWQTPGCFVKGLEFTPSPTNRGKCKYSGLTFQKGQARMSMTSQSTTVHVMIQYVGKVLEPLIEALRDPSCAIDVDPNTLRGFSSLSPEDQNVVRECFGEISPTGKVSFTTKTISPTGTVSFTTTPETNSPMTSTVTIQYCGGWGYGPKARLVKEHLDDAFTAKNVAIDVSLIRDPGTTGNFEIKFEDKLIHSKKNGDGFVIKEKFEDLETKILTEFELKESLKESELKLKDLEKYRYNPNPS